MAKVLVLYYSAYGHIEKMAEAEAEGARYAGAIVDIKRVPELVPPEIAPSRYFKLDQAAPVASVADLEHYDAIIVGTGTRFGRMARRWRISSIRRAASGRKGALNGKVGGAFTSTATQHGGQETTLFSIITNLLHFGMVIVGLDYGYAGQMRLDEVDRRRALWRDDDRRQRWIAPAERHRTRRRALSGPPDRRGRGQTVRVRIAPANAPPPLPSPSCRRMRPCLISCALRLRSAVC